MSTGTDRPSGAALTTMHLSAGLVHCNGSDLPGVPCFLGNFDLASAGRNTAHTQQRRALTGPNGAMLLPRMTRIDLRRLHTYLHVCSLAASSLGMYVCTTRSKNSSRLLRTIHPSFHPSIHPCSYIAHILEIHR